MAAPVRVVLVHWNQPARLAATVAALGASEGVEVRITVVDNDSTPPLPDDVEGVEVVLRSGGNAGFGPGANVGLRHFLADPGDGDYVVVAPHDSLPARDALARMVAELDARPDAGLACADYGDGMTPVTDPYLGGMLVPMTVEEGWQPAGFPHGTLLVARRACLQDVGLFDERYFSYCEEVDLGIRARTSGWDVGLVRGAMVVNPDQHGAMPAVSYLQLRNTLLLVKERSSCYHASQRILLQGLLLALGVVAPRTRDPYWHVEAHMRAIGDFLRGRFGPPPADLLVKR